MARTFPLSLLAVSATLLFACSASMNASELAGAVGESYIAEEDEVLATCRALERGDAAGPDADPRRKSLAEQVKRDRQKRAKALLDAVGLKGVDDASVGQLLACSEAGSSERCQTIVAELSPKIGELKGGPVLAVVGFSLEAKTPDEAARVGKERLLAEIAGLSERFNFAHATVLGLVQVAQLVEGMVDDVSESFGYFKGFASPLLERVSAELIAVGMDGVLGDLEKTGHVSAASVAAHACKVYQRIDPASAVTNRVVRRAILRFSGSSYGKSSGMIAACKELSKKKDGDAVCKEILEDHVGVTIAGLGEDDASLEAVLQPLPSEASAADPGPTDEQKRALEVASKACLDDAAREGACTLDRVARVASVLAELQRFEGESGTRFASLEARIDRFEESLSLLHNKVDRLGGDIERAEARTAALSDSIVATRKEVTDVRDRVAGAESAILGALGKQVKTGCRDHVQKVMKARNDLAKELGIGAIDPCPITGGSGGGTIKVYATRFPSVTVRHEELCDQRFVTVTAQVTFDQGAFDCPASGCLDKTFRDLVVAKVGKPGAGLVLVGNADATPIINKKRIRDAWRTKKADAKNATLLPEIPQTTENDDELQRLLSMMRAMAVRDEIASGTIVLDALGKQSNRRGVDVRFVLPDLTLDLATNCQN
jgi:hypothetical protein